MTKQLKADLLLLLITVFWGASYILTKMGLLELQPYNLTALRFIVAFVIAAAIFYKRILKTDRMTLKYALILSVILFLVFITMTFGLQYTSASNAGFLVSLSVVFIPIISAAFFKQKIEGKMVIGVGLAFIGIMLLTLNTQLKMSSGDLLCIACAVLFALHVIITGIYTREVDSVNLSVLQLGFVGLLSLLFSLTTETFRMPVTSLSWFAILSLSILCTVVGYIVQTTAQQYTSATHTGLILSLEQVFSAVFAYLYLGEVLSLRGYVGAAILLLSVLVAELDIIQILRKLSRKQSSSA